MNIPFARRTQWALSPNKLISALDELKNADTPIIDLTQSNPSRCEFTSINKDLLPALNNTDNLSYEPSPRGSLKAREAVCQYYQTKNISINSEQVFLTSSTSEVYTYLFRLLADAHDHVLFPRPSYPLFPFLVDINDLVMDTYPLVYADGWRLDVDQLEREVTSKTKAVVLVNPNNPTGSFIHKDELKKLNDVCQKYNLAIISDEVFYDFAFDDGHYVSLANHHDGLTFSLGGLSKTLGLPQMKLAWIIVNGPQATVDQAVERLEVIADTYLSVNTPVQNALSVWLSKCNQIQQEIKTRVRLNLEYLSKMAGSVSQCQLLKSQGGWYAVVKISDAIDEEELALTLLKEDHVYVHPGYFFDFDEGAHLIISLLPKADVFQEGIKLILDRMDKN